MRQLRICFITAVILVLLTCSTTIAQDKPGDQPASKPAEKSNWLTDQQAKKISKPILDKMLKALEEGDYEAYTSDMSKKTKRSLTRQKFNRLLTLVKSQVGRCQSMEYVGVVNRKNVWIVLWKGEFDRAIGEVLIRLTLVKENGVFKVAEQFFQ